MLVVLIAAIYITEKVNYVYIRRDPHRYACMLQYMHLTVCVCHLCTCALYAKTFLATLHQPFHVHPNSLPCKPHAPANIYVDIQHESDEQYILQLLIQWVQHKQDKKLQYCSSDSCCINKRSYEPLWNHIYVDIRNSPCMHKHTPSTSPHTSLACC